MADDVAAHAGTRQGQAAPRVEILAIGDELMHGGLVDTNSSYIASVLGRFGCDVLRCTVVGDAQEHLESALLESAARADVVVATGGLGPTEDDRSRHALAAAAGVELQFDAASQATIDDYLAARGRTAGPDNRRQALLPRGAEPLINRWGTAPGIAQELHSGGRSALVCMLPGVPTEMRAMLDAHVLPRIEQRAAAGGSLRPSATRLLRVLGPSEAALGKQLESRMVPRDDVLVGITAHHGLLTVRVIARGDTRELAEQAADVEAAEVATLCGSDLVYRGDESFAERAIHRLTALGRTVSVAESCTGGLLASMLTDVPGSSVAFPGGFVCYSNRRKTIDLGVSEQLLQEHGAVSEPVAASMVEGVARVTGSDYGLSLTGIAGPGGGSEDKPVGTVCFGLWTPDGCRTWTRKITAISRSFVRERAAYEALGALLRALPQAEPGGS